MPDPIVGQTTQSQPIVGQTTGQPVTVNPQPIVGQTTGQPVSANPLTPGQVDPALNSNVGNYPAPINNTQLATLFNAQPIQAPVNQQLNSLYGQQQLGYGNSPLAGLTNLGNVSNAGAPGINTAVSNQLTGAQLQNINALNTQAQGLGPSPATVAAQQQAQQNVANEMAMVGSQRGGSANTALGLRSAQNAMAQANQQGVQAATLGKTQEELAAQQQLTGALGGAQGQVQQGAQAQAGLQSTANLQNAAASNQAMLQQGSMAQQTAMQNLSAQLQTQGYNATEINSILQAQMAQANNQISGQMNYGNLVTGENTQLQGINANLAIANNANQMGLQGAYIAGGSALAAGGLSALSDRNLKTDIKSGDKSVKDFLNKLGSKPSQFKLLESF